LWLRYLFSIGTNSIKLEKLSTMASRTATFPNKTNKLDAACG